jgi:GDPmannose 4,6-dehydratase
MFGQVQEVPQTERTPFHPTQSLRLRQGLRVLDHCELPRILWTARQQRHSFQPRVPAARRDLRDPQDHPCRGAYSGRALQTKMYLGNLDAKRDWGYAKEYVEAMWLMLQQEQPDDYVIATGETHSIREFLDVRVRPCGNGLAPGTSRLTRATTGRRRSTCSWATPPRQDRKLGWEPRTNSCDLVKLMVDGRYSAPERSPGGTCPCHGLSERLHGGQSRALITGITGQDGSYLTELLLEKGIRGARPGPSHQRASADPGSIISTGIRPSTSDGSFCITRTWTIRRPCGGC